VITCLCFSSFYIFFFCVLCALYFRVDCCWVLWVVSGLIAAGCCGLLCFWVPSFWVLLESLFPFFIQSPPSLCFFFLCSFPSACVFVLLSVPCIREDGDVNVGPLVFLLRLSLFFFVSVPCVIRLPPLLLVFYLIFRPRRPPWSWVSYPFYKDRDLQKPSPPQPGSWQKTWSRLGSDAL